MCMFYCLIGLLAVRFWFYDIEKLYSIIQIFPKCAEVATTIFCVKILGPNHTPIILSGTVFSQGLISVNGKAPVAQQFYEL